MYIYVFNDILPIKQVNERLKFLSKSNTNNTRYGYINKETEFENDNDNEAEIFELKLKNYK